MDIAAEVLQAALRLNEQIAALEFAPERRWRYNPLEYAWNAYRLYTEEYGNSRKRVLFLGMNPGPWGMVQTGIPFGEIAAVRDWMGINVPIGTPRQEHPKRPVQGFACPRSEVSGRRLWALMAKRFESAERFFRDHFVLNYCPLVFMEESGRNLTPNRLPAAERQALDAACDRHLADVVKALDPLYLVGVGKYAEQKLLQINRHVTTRTVIQILHPSPASPAANRGWEQQAEAQLQQSGVWLSKPI